MFVFCVYVHLGGKIMQMLNLKKRKTRKNQVQGGIERERVIGKSKSVFAGGYYCFCFRWYSLLFLAFSTSYANHIRSETISHTHTHTTFEFRIIDSILSCIAFGLVQTCSLIKLTLTFDWHMNHSLYTTKFKFRCLRMCKHIYSEENEHINDGSDRTV